MGDEAALLAAIKANPAEDTPRLVYADWLDEHDQADRANYIRWHLGLRPESPRPFAVSPSLEWVPPIPGHTRRELVDRVAYLDGDGVAISLIFRRGFADEVVCTADDWFRNADAFTAHPITTAVITTVPDVIFGGVDYYTRPDHNLGPRGYRRGASWEAISGVGLGLGQSPDQFGLEVEITGWMIAEGDEVRAAANFGSHVEAMRTPRVYLQSKWPGVRFVVSPGAPPNGA